MNKTATMLSVDPGNAATPLLVTAEAARLLSVHPKTLIKWAREGVVPCFSFERQYRFDLNEVKSALRSGSWNPRQ